MNWDHFKDYDLIKNAYWNGFNIYLYGVSKSGKTTLIKDLLDMN